MEATGKYHRVLHERLHEAGVPVAVINPFRSRQFADSMGKLAKSDRIDAEVLAQFAERMKPEPTQPPTEEHKALRELQSARRQVVDELSDLKRKLQSTDHPLAAKLIRARLDLATAHKQELEKELQALVEGDAEMKRKLDILSSIPGIGKTTATILISDLSELGQVNARQIAALAGVAPMNWDSGAKHGNRMVRGGRKCVRNALYMCAVAADAGGPGAVYFEEVRRHVGTDAAHLYGGFLATLTAWREQRGVAYEGVPVGTIKRHVTGKGNADKAAVMAAVRARGFVPADDNEADAIATLLWAIEAQGGVR